ncbi:MAG TPA: alpha/beta hydrolase [Acidimicrobiales bacterium]|nr:alpha/beta hydrolase [Acidimicrobiales bacterium]
MPNVHANGITIEYDEFGDPGNPPLVLIMGLGQQMIAWDAAFCELLAERGLRVIRFDNRDVGLSSKIEGGPTPDLMAALFQRDTSSASYLLSDMAADAAGLLDALGIEAAHIVGASMGGMIAQTFAIAYPERTLSLCSIMSTTGQTEVGQPRPEIAPLLISPGPRTKEEAMDRWVETTRAIGSQGLPQDWERVRATAAAAWDRCVYPIGFVRQLIAIIASGDRTAQLANLDVPTVVIHGTDDTLVDPSGGRATADAIPGAELVVVDGMGHDLPPSSWPQVVDVITRNIERTAVAR